MRGWADPACMKLLPSGRLDLLNFVTAHLPVWQAEPAAVGLSDAQVAAMATLLADADAAFAHAKAVREEAQAATLISNTRLAALRDSTAAALASVKSFAGNQRITGGAGAEDAVYAGAQIALPLSPAPLPAPGEVRSITLNVDGTGRPTITWRAPHPRNARERAASSSGLIYEIHRKRPGESAFSSVTGTSQRTFTDAPLPAGMTLYMVRARRGRRGSEGPWSIALSVEAGIGGTGGNSAGMGRAMKIAA